jgi:hypothetical protein
VGVAHRRPQQALDPVDPVRRQPVGVDLDPSHPVTVGQHRDRRLQYRHRVAQREGDRGIGEGGQQRAELLEVLRGLQHPPVRAAQVRQHLQLSAQERVVGPLVEPEVVVAPPRHPGVPFERVRAHVEVDQLAVLLDAPRRPVVHECRQRRVGVGQLPLGEAAGVARVDPVAPRPVPEHRRGLADLPPRHRPEAGVGGQQVHQVGRARAGEAHHDDRRLQLDGERLGVAAHEVLEPQPRPQQAERAVAHQVAAEAREPGIGVDRGQVVAEAVDHAGVAQVVEARLRPRPGHQRVGVEVDLHGERHLVDGLLLRPTPRLAQVLDPYLSHRPAPLPLPVAPPSSRGSGSSSPTQSHHDITKCDAMIQSCARR